MSWHADPQICFFGRDRRIRGIRRRRDWKPILALAIALMATMGIREAWNHEVIASAALTAKLCVVAIWNMLSDFAAACWDCLKYVFSQRSH